MPSLLHQVQKNFYNCTQKPYIYSTAYLERFKYTVNGLESYGGNMGQDDVLLHDDPLYTEPMISILMIPMIPMCMIPGGEIMFIHDFVSVGNII